MTDDDLPLLPAGGFGFGINLDLSGTKISDRGLKHLAQVHWLIVARTQITDEGLRQFAGAGTLFGLDVSDTRVTDAGLAHLKSLPNLRYLQLAGTRVTTAGLTQLESATTLVEIDARRTPIRDEDLPALRKKLLNARITIRDDDAWRFTPY